MRVMLVIMSFRKNHVKLMVSVVVIAELPSNEIPNHDIPFSESLLVTIVVVVKVPIVEFHLERLPIKLLPLKSHLRIRPQLITPHQQCLSCTLVSGTSKGLQLMTILAFMNLLCEVLRVSYITPSPAKWTTFCTAINE